MKHIDISKCFIVASIYQKLSIAKDKVRRIASRFKWLYKFFSIFLYWFTTVDRKSVERRAKLHNLMPFYFPPVCSAPLTIIVVWCICWKNRILTCITAVEHLDTLGIPVFHKNVMSIDLHMISFAIVVSLIHDSGVIDIFAISDPSIFYTYRGRVRPF